MAIVIGAKSKLGSGGTRSTAGIYVIHEFDSSGTFTPGSTGKVDIVAIGGGGSRGPQGPPSWGTGGGAGGVILRKFLNVTAGTAYTMTVAGVNGLTTAFYDGGAVTAHNGAQGSAGQSSGNPGGISTAASGSGGGGWNVSAGGTGANIVGQGMPGFASPPSAGASSSTGGGGGAQSGGPVSTFQIAGGDGVNIGYFTGNPAHIVSIGGPGYNNQTPEGTPNPRAAELYGNGGGVVGPSNSEGTTPAQPGAIFIRYI